MADVDGFVRQSKRALIVHTSTSTLVGMCTLLLVAFVPYAVCVPYEYVRDCKRISLPAWFLAAAILLPRTDRQSIPGTREQQDAVSLFPTGLKVLF